MQYLLKSALTLSMSLLMINMSFATNEDPPSLSKENNYIRNEITNQLYMTPVEENGVTAQISFVINNQNEVDIRKIFTDDKDLERTIQSRLDGHKLRKDIQRKNEQFFIRITFDH